MAGVWGRGVVCFVRARVIRISDRDDELAAARAVNRDLMTRINLEPEKR